VQIIKTKVIVFINIVWYYNESAN